MSSSSRSLRPRAANGRVVVAALAAAANAPLPGAAGVGGGDGGANHYILRDNRILLCPVCLRSGFVYEKEIAKHLLYHSAEETRPYKFDNDDDAKYNYQSMFNVTAEQAGFFLEPDVIEWLLDTINRGSSFALMPVGFHNSSKPADDQVFFSMLARLDAQVAASLAAVGGAVPAGGVAPSSGLAGPVPAAPGAGAATTTTAAADTTTATATTPAADAPTTTATAATEEDDDEAMDEDDDDDSWEDMDEDE